MNKNIKVTLPVLGMDCASCALSVEKKLKSTEGVNACNVNYGNEKAVIEYNPELTNIPKLNESLNPLGYSLLSKEENIYDKTKLEKEQKLKEEKRKVLLSFPSAIIVFFIMIWQKNLTRTQTKGDL